MSTSPHAESVEALAKVFHTDLKKGLTSQQVLEHRKIYGENGGS